MIRALIVDDEPIARDGLRAALAEHADIEVVGECRDGASAVDAIRATRPDVVLLDVQMPGVDGFGVLERVGFDAAPAVVFVTAHDDYAVRAFDAHAVDYLLKPFSNERLADALDRVRARRRAEDAERNGETLAALARTYREAADAPTYRKRLLARDGERVVFVRAEDIEWLEADGNHVRVHARDGLYSIRATLTGTLDELDPARFVRTHRSAAVNLDCVRELQTWFGGDGAVVLHSGEQVKVSRQYRDALLKQAR